MNYGDFTGTGLFMRKKEVNMMVIKNVNVNCYIFGLTLTDMWKLISSSYTFIIRLH